MNMKRIRLCSAFLSGVALLMLSVGMVNASSSALVLDKTEQLYSYYYNPAGPSSTPPVAYLNLTSKCYFTGSAYTYEYTLENPVANADYKVGSKTVKPISDFTLLINNIQDSYEPITSPTGWGLQCDSEADTYRFHWYATGAGLTPGNSLVFSFTANTSPSDEPILATAMSFGGDAYGPSTVPEPCTVLAALSVLAPVGLVFRRRQTK